MDHIVAETEHQLSERIDRAIAGEGVVITRNGKPVAPPAFPEPLPMMRSPGWRPIALGKSCPKRTRLD